MLAKCIKIILLAVPLMVAAYFFGTVCQRMGGSYQLVLFPSRGFLVLLLWLLFAVGTVAVTAGIVAVLLRPWWVAFVAFGLSGAAMLLGWEISWRNMILTALYILGGAAYAAATQSELKQRIKFSVRPVAEGQSILLAVLLVVALGSLYFASAEQIRREGFSLPERYMNRLTEEVAKQLATKVPAGLREAVLREVKQQLGRVQDDMLQRVKRFERFIPVALALSLFTSLWTITRFLSWLPALILSVVFPLLRTVRIAKMTTETMEVSRLVLS